MEENTEEINIPLSYIFSLFNVLFIIYSQYFVKSKDNKERLLKFRIFLLIVCDSFIIIFELIYKNYLNQIFYEIIYTLLYAFQFFECISFITETIINLNNVEEKEIINSFLLSFICYLIIFPYYKFLYFHRIAVLIMQNLGNSFGIICFNFYVRNILRNISENKYKNMEHINKRISSLNNICLILFLLFNLLKLAEIIFNNMNFSLVIFYSYFIIKYIIFILLIRIASILSNSNFNKPSNGTDIDITNYE